MKQGFFRFFCLAVILSLTVAACGGKNDRENKTDDRPVLAVSILPQSYFASRIAENRVRIMTLVGPGQNPHDYEPSPKQMADLAAAKVWVLSNTEFEITLRPKVEALFPDLTIVDGTQGVRFRNLEDGDDHGDTIDRHTWLGHKPARIMAAHIQDALIKMDTDGESLYRNNYRELTGDMDQEFGALREKLSPLRGKIVFVYHPAFGYFLDEFGIIQEAVETGGKEPTPRALKLLIERAKSEKAAAIFVQAQFPVSTAKTTADAAGAILATLDPLAPDWLANIRTMGEVLQKNVGETGK
ncbi:zinc ABC transporter substrate-binding protein [Treponema primitia]|uniref:metal ABC transporter solute-binding protein, Zn/Mn family n=1 Tax=Treponema primitia TaxID=88058 RepID=UPI00397EB289